MMNRVARVAVIAVSAVALAACAADDGTGAEPATTPSGETQTPEVPVVEQEAASIPLLPGSHGQGYPDGIEPGDEVRAAGGTGVARTVEDGVVYVLTAGSGSCPPVVESNAVLGDDGTLVVSQVEIPEATPCTQDFRPFTSVVAVPNGTDFSTTVTFTVEAANGTGPVATVELPANAAPGEVAWATF